VVSGSGLFGNTPLPDFATAALLAYRRASLPMSAASMVEEYGKTHGGRKRIEAPDPYPTPGRMSSVDQ
jgi:hypothetical protein